MASRRRTGIRRAAKWAGLSLCVLIAGLWAVSLRFDSWGKVDLPGGRGFLVGLAPGGVTMVVFSESMNSRWGTLYARNWKVGPRDAVGSPRAIWWPARTSLVGQWSSDGVPFWMVLGVAALPTAWFWWRDRRRAQPGHCAACGYDLAGLATPAPCPECGARAAAG